jgi:hypothetical protein
VLVATLTMTVKVFAGLDTVQGVTLLLRHL